MVELLIAALLMTMLLAAAHEALSLATKRTADDGNAERNLRAAMEMLGTDLRCAWLDVGDPRAFFIVRRNGAFGQMDFVRAAGDGDSPTFAETGYAVRINAGGKGDLWRRGDDGHDGDPLKGGRETSVLDDVTGFEVLVFDGLAWQQEWGWSAADGAPLRGIRGLPIVVSVRLSTGRGSAAREEHRVFPVYTALLGRALHG